MTTSEDNKAATVDFFIGVFNRGDMTLVDRFISPNYHYNGSPSSPAATAAWATGMRAHMPGLEFVVEAILAEDDKVALRWRLLIPASSGQPAGHIVGSNILVFAGGQAINNDQGGGSGQDFVPN